MVEFASKDIKSILGKSPTEYIEKNMEEIILGVFTKEDLKNIFNKKYFNYIRRLENRSLGGCINE